MAQEIRKVTFALNVASGFTPDDTEQRELDELSRRREGLFHGTTEVQEGELKKTKFIIEDVQTGKMHEVNPLLVEFVK